MSDAASAASAAAGMPASPCVGICRLDPDTGWCTGCGRDADELARWRDLSPAARARSWADLPRRKAALGLAFRLLPLAGQALLDHLARLAKEPGTGWSIGVHGAVAAFAAREGEAPRVEHGPEGLLLRAAGGALRLRPPAGTRLFELVGASGRVERLALALHRSRLSGPGGMGVTELGADAAAIDRACRDDRLFDLGVAAGTIRFCVRTGEPRLGALLRRAIGMAALAPAAGLVQALMAADPDRVVFSPMGRIEVSGPILRQDHAGPHTYLLPALLAQGRLLEPGLELPAGYVAGACITPVQRA